MGFRIKDNVLVKYNEQAGVADVIIPNGVIEIGASAFSSCRGLKSITIPNSVNKIGNGAFWHCDNLESVHNLDGVTEVGDEAFYYCRNLKEIILPNSIELIGNGAFKCCESLEEVILPNSLTKIKKSMFYNCTKLKRVMLPKVVTCIDDNAFSYCTSLENIDIPNSVNWIGGYAFYGCKNLKKVVLPKSIKNITDGTFMYCRSLKCIKFPQGLNKIGCRAFSHCEELENIVIVGKFKRSNYYEVGIYEYAFEMCNKLKEITFSHWNGCVDIKAFIGCDNLESITLTDSRMSLYGDVYYLKYSGIQNIKNINVSSYRVFLEVDDDLELIALRSFIKNYYTGQTKYKEKDIFDFKEYIKLNRIKLFPYATIDMNLCDFMFNKIDKIYSPEDIEKLFNLINDGGNEFYKIRVEGNAILLQYIHKNNLHTKSKELTLDDLDDFDDNSKDDDEKGNQKKLTN